MSELPVGWPSGGATYPLQRVRDSYRELENGHTFGKIVLIP